LGTKTCFICDAMWRKTKVIRILTRYNKLSNGWMKTLNLVSKIVNKKYASSNWLIKDKNVGKQSQNTQV